MEEFRTPLAEVAEDRLCENNPSEATTPVQHSEEPEIQADNNIAEPVMATPGPQVKIRNFAGEPGEKGSVWYKTYKNVCCNMYGYTEAKVKATFVFYLIGQALAWYNSLSDAVKDDSDAVYDAFLQRFDGSDAGFALGSIKQRVTESVSDFHTRFMDMTNDQGMPIPWLVATFIDGLLTPVRKIVKPQELLSLDAARKAAIRAEQSVNDSVEVCPVGAATSDSKMDQLVSMMTELCNKLDSQTTQPQQPQQRQKQSWSHRQYEHQNNRQGRNHYIHPSRENSFVCGICKKNHKTDDCPDIALANRLYFNHKSQ